MRIDNPFKEYSFDLNPTQHPLQHGQLVYSPGGHFCYRVMGSCCRLFDREELPWPCCRLQWRGKEPSWRRVGRRFTPDLATVKSPSYSVEVIGQEQSSRTFVVTLYADKLPKPLQEWWHSKKMDGATIAPPTPAFSPDSAVHTGQPAS
jgi:hypothetical protein